MKTNTTRFAIAFVASLAALCAIIVGTASAGSSTICTAKDGKNVRVVAGVRRCDKTRIRTIVNTTGVEGDSGPAGPKGATGAVGPAGVAGAVGAVGAAGPTGPIGPTGPAGPAGPTGADGAGSASSMIGSYGGVSKTAKSYLPLFVHIGGAQPSELLGQTPFPVTGNVGNLFVDISAAVAGPAGANYTFTVRKNGADLSPSVTCSIAVGETSCSDLINTGSFGTVGDRFSLESSPSAGPSAPTSTGTYRFVLKTG